MFLRIGKSSRAPQSYVCSNLRVNFAQTFKFFFDHGGFEILVGFLNYKMGNLIYVPLYIVFRVVLNQKVFLSFAVDEVNCLIQ